MGGRFGCWSTTAVQSWLMLLPRMRRHCCCWTLVAAEESGAAVWCSKCWPPEPYTRWGGHTDERVFSAGAAVVAPRSYSQFGARESVRVNEVPHPKPPPPLLPSGSEVSSGEKKERKRTAKVRASEESARSRSSVVVVAGETLNELTDWSDWSDWATLSCSHSLSLSQLWTLQRRWHTHSSTTTTAAAAAVLSATLPSDYGHWQCVQRRLPLPIRTALDSTEGEGRWEEKSEQWLVREKTTVFGGTLVLSFGHTISCWCFSWCFSSAAIPRSGLLSSLALLPFLQTPNGVYTRTALTEAIAWAVVVAVILLYGHLLGPLRSNSSSCTAASAVLNQGACLLLLQSIAAVMWRREVKISSTELRGQRGQLFVGWLVVAVLVFRMPSKASRSLGQWPFAAMIDVTIFSDNFINLKFFYLL